MNDSARLSGLTDPRFPGLAPELVLKQWSRIVSDDFERMNSLTASAGEDVSSLTALLVEQNRLLSDLRQDAIFSKRKRDEQHHCQMEAIKAVNRELDITKSTLFNENDLLKKEVARLRSKCAILKSPEPVPDAEIVLSPPSARRRLNHSPPLSSKSPPSLSATQNKEPRSRNKEHTPVPNGKQDSVIATGLMEHPVVHITTAAVADGRKGESTGMESHTTTCTIEFGRRAKTMSEKTGNGKLELHMLLKNLHVNRWFALNKGTPYKLVDGPGYINEQQLFRNFLQLVEYVFTPEQRTFLEGDAPKSTDHDQIYIDVARACIDKMWEFEGKNPVVERRTLSKKAGRKTSATLCGIGPRIRNYKKKIAVGLMITNKKEVTNIDLREPADIPKKALPPGQTTIVGHYGMNKNNNNGNNKATGKSAN